MTATDRLRVDVAEPDRQLPPGLAGAVRFTLFRADGRTVALRGGAGVVFGPGVTGADGRMRMRILRSPRLSGCAGEWVLTAEMSDADEASAHPSTHVAYRSRDLIDWSEPEPIAGIGSGDQEVDVDSEEGDRLERRFGRIHSVTVRVDECGPLADRAATISYSDGSTRRAAVRWGEPDDEGNVHGTIPVLDASFPWIADRADPQVFRFDGRWYFVGTPDAGRGNENTPALFIRGADELDSLPIAADRVISEIGEAGIGGCFWAPELHVIGGALHILFAPSIGTASWDGVQAHIMTLRAGGDPLRREDWGRPEPVRTRAGEPLQVPGRPGISLDMTYIETATGNWYVWSQRVVEGAHIGDAELWVASVDPADPTRLSDDPKLLHTGRESWEIIDTNVVEGPYALRHGGDIHLVYAAAAVGPHYATGILTAPLNADLGDAAVWHRQKYPVLDSSSVPGQWGPGHVSFFRTDEGDDIMAFHAKRAFDEHARHTGIRRVHWAVGGRPVFDMTPAEDLHPDLRDVTTRIGNDQ